MNQKEKVLLGMSGGVDSSVSAILLKEQGYEVVGVTMNLIGTNEKEREDAKKVCDQLGIQHYTLDETAEFKRRVIDPFVKCYEQCLTPNPCVECNRYLKFGKMYEFAQSLGIDKIATGHYARIEKDVETGEMVLKKSASLQKDQSYVLYAIPKELLSHILFPLEGYESKEEIREIAKKYQLPIAEKPDSQDICFIPDGDYASFLEKQMGKKAKKGNIVNQEGKILGIHKGLHHYTIGQRRGLGIANPVPLFVRDFREEKNELVVGEEAELYQSQFQVSDVNWLSDYKEKTLEVTVKVRYHAKEAKAKISKQGEKVIVDLYEPQKGITPGQSAVFYQKDQVIGGGKIERMKE